jgi:hypothetical protein
MCFVIQLVLCQRPAEASDMTTWLFLGIDEAITAIIDRLTKR